MSGPSPRTCETSSSLALVTMTQERATAMPSRIVFYFRQFGRPRKTGWGTRVGRAPRAWCGAAPLLSLGHLRLPLPGREGKGEGRADSWLRLHVNRALMIANDAIGQGKAEPGAGLLGRLEESEDPREEHGG